MPNVSDSVVGQVSDCRSVGRLSDSCVSDSVRQCQTQGMKGSSPSLNPNPTEKPNPKPTQSKNGVSDSLTTKKGASHQDSLRSTSATGSAMGLLLCAAPAASAYPALLHGHLIAPDLAPRLITPRAHWRQLPIKGRGLFHAYNVQISKATLQKVVDNLQLCTPLTGPLLAPET